MSKLYEGLGFEAFSLALLASHWWRLIHKEDSLVYKVLQARYFPKGNPMMVSVSCNSSFLLRSLLRGRDIVREGSIWRDCDGSKIDIFRDNWLTHYPG